jgi:hypothetical protein
MNNSEFAALISDVYKKSFIDIMANYKCEVYETEERDELMEFSSSVSVDAGAKDFEMSIALKMPYSSLEKSIPINSSRELIDEGELEDWLCEISNMLIGAVKAELLKRNCHLQIGLPQCNADEELHEIIPSGYQHVKYSFTVAHERCESIVSLQFLEEQIDCSDLVFTNDDEVERSELELF